MIQLLLFFFWNRRIQGKNIPGVIPDKSGGGVVVLVENTPKRYQYLVL